VIGLITDQEHKVIFITIIGYLIGDGVSFGIYEAVLIAVRVPEITSSLGHQVDDGGGTDVGV